ncbi:MAG: glycosyltransferase family 4 protein [Synergistaceae bacterium]|jgi:glycosyltransferase involved in cell wall biosynthesis|nr:glycosyltransferase family 4 protein [Synergistaceae bacterium]
MNIMHFLPELEEGGVERLVPMYANGQSRLGHRVAVVSNGGKLESLLCDSVNHIKMPVHKKNPLTISECAVRIASLARQDNVSIVHAHSRMPAWICLLVKKLVPGVKFIYTAHARFPSLDHSTWPISRADGITCISRSVLESLKTWLPPQKNMRVIYNPVPENAIKWQGSGDRMKKHLLFAGRISKIKGLLTLLESLKLVKNRNWSLDVLGDGPLAPRLKELASEPGLKDSITLHGFNDDVAGFMSRCDLCLFPSLDEGFGLILLGALMSGTPVLASDIPATRELTSRAGENPGGELLPPGDPPAWAGAIERFLDGGLSPSLGLAIKLPAPDETVEQMTDFYEETLKQA